jgi:N-acylneuraminate cytidylyltransferase
MVTPEHVLALVPARGGSKSIPRKNIRPLAGHPLLAYSVAAGLQSELVTRVIVSTDDEEIAEVARGYGAETPFLRPAALAQDDTQDLPVFLHALEWLEKEEGYRPEVVVQLRPTSPVRPPDCVDRAVQILLEHPEADSVRGVVPSGQNPYKMWRIDARGRMLPLLRDGFEEPFNMPRQKLPPTYWQTGHVDGVRPDTILKKGSMSGAVILPIVIDPRYTVDIDNQRDWQRTERLLAQGDLQYVRPGRRSRPLPQQVDMVVFDFDGVFTDNRVWVNERGEEWVAASRGDGWGIARLLARGVGAMVLSTEKNHVVAARCDKLGLPYVQGADDKAQALQEIMAARNLKPENVIYLGNDVNDAPCFPLVGCALVTADAHPRARLEADLALSRPGGFGAVRELCDLIIERIDNEERDE